MARIFGHTPLTETKSGVLILTGDDGAVSYPGQRRERNASASIMGVSVRLDPTKEQPRKDADGWEHFTYVFTYRFEDRTFSLTYRYGTGVDHARLIDGIRSAFDDARLTEEGFQDFAESLGFDLDDPAEYRRAVRSFDECERLNARLDAFLGEHRQAWAEGTAKR